MQPRWVAVTLAGLFVGIVAGAMTKTNDSRFQEWEKIKDPLSAPAHTIGGYSAGCLAGGTKLDKDGKGFSLMRLSRNRYYGHPSMISYLNNLGEKLQNDKMPFLLVGDVSPPRGGPMRTGHASHQIGLDVDLWFMMLARKPTLKEREKLSAPSYVVGRKKLKKSWSSTQTKLLVTAADHESVNRIFVSPAIKKHFCEKFPKSPWLYKLRPWWGHEDHLHVRLNCPSDSPLCKPQPALDANDSGCGTDLEWWFSKEADDEWAKISSQVTEREFPTLPMECDVMLK